MRRHFDALVGARRRSDNALVVSLRARDESHAQLAVAGSKLETAAAETE
jgi:hypothetical protein